MISRSTRRRGISFCWAAIGHQATTDHERRCCWAADGEIAVGEDEGEYVEFQQGEMSIAVSFVFVFCPHSMCRLLRLQRHPTDTGSFYSFYFLPARAPICGQVDGMAAASQVTASEQGKIRAMARVVADADADADAGGEGSTKRSIKVVLHRQGIADEQHDTHNGEDIRREERLPESRDPAWLQPAKIACRFAGPATLRPLQHTR